MTQNLRLVGPITLTSANSNVTSNFLLKAPAATTGWCEEYSDSCYNQSLSSIVSGYEDYGAYYNWYTATAGTGQRATVSQYVWSSICPKGWRLTNGMDGLNTAYGSTGMLRAPVSMKLAGTIDASGNIVYRNSIGIFWSNYAVGNNVNYAQNIYIDAYGTYSTNPYEKKSACAIRCMATN